MNNAEIMEAIEAKALECDKLADGFHKDGLHGNALREDYAAGVLREFAKELSAKITGGVSDAAGQ